MLQQYNDYTENQLEVPINYIILLTGFLLLCFQAITIIIKGQLRFKLYPVRNSTIQNQIIYVLQF